MKKLLLISLTCVLGLSIFALQAKRKAKVKPVPLRKARIVDACPPKCVEKCEPRCKKRCRRKKRCCKKARCGRRCGKKFGGCCRREKRCDELIETICCPKVVCEEKITEVPVTRYDIKEIKCKKTVPRIEKVCRQVPITIMRTVCEERVVPVDVPDYKYEAVPRKEIECIHTTDEVCDEVCRESCRTICRELPVVCPCP